MKELDDSIIKKILYRTMLFLRRNQITRNFYFLLEDIGVRIVLSKIFNYFNNKRLCSNPTEEIIKSKDYFETHNFDINRILSFLSDEKSKNVYLVSQGPDGEFFCEGNVDYTFKQQSNSEAECDDIVISVFRVKKAFEN